MGVKIKVQVAQEADQKLRHHRHELQSAKIANNELRTDLKELVDKNAGFARQCQEGERDRAQLQAEFFNRYMFLISKIFLSETILDCRSFTN